MGQEVTRGCRELSTDVKKRTTLKAHNSKNSRDILLEFSLLEMKV